MLNNMPRRRFIELSALAAGGLVVGPSIGDAAPAAAPAPANPSADVVLKQLLEGNNRFVNGQPVHPRRSPADFAPLAEGQNPIACIVGCADSRVSPELIFDQGVGDLFVVRVAGNVVSGAGPIVKGSIEYAVAELRVPLIMVLGHSQCGAVKAAMKHIEAHDPLPGALADLVAAIQPAVTRASGQRGDALENAIRANVELGVERLKTLAPILADAVKAKKLQIVGATYDLRTGKVVVLA
jgi:carbonic anhydrase